MPTENKYFNDMTDILPDFKNTYLSNVLISIAEEHPEFYDEILFHVQEAHTALVNDKTNKRIENACIPCYPYHHKLAEFDEDYIDEKNLESLNEYKSGRPLLGYNPNCLIYGIPGQTDILFSGLADELCRKEFSVYMIDYHDFAEMLTHHNLEGADNKKAIDNYKKCLGTNCLMIRDFAGKNIYDEDLTANIYNFIHERETLHEKNVFRSGNKKKDLNSNYKLYATIVLSYVDPAEWFDKLSGPERVMLIRNIVEGKGTTIKIEKQPEPEKDEQADQSKQSENIDQATQGDQKQDVSPTNQNSTPDKQQG